LKETRMEHDYWYGTNNHQCKQCLQFFSYSLYIVTYSELAAQKNNDSK